MTPIEKERQLFCEGCMIEAEINLEDGTKVRLVSTPKGESYKLTYHRNEHYVFVIHDITQI